MPSPVRVFCAVAQRPVPYDPAVLPSLGDALLLDVATLPHQMDIARAALRAAPWCAVLLVARQPLLVTEVARLLPLLPRHVAPLLDGQEADGITVRQAIRRRPRPTLQDVLDYLRLRQLDRSLIAAVEDALALAAGSGADADTPDGADEEPARATARRSPSSVNRELSRHSTLRCREWRALLRLLPILESPPTSLEQLARDHDVDARTLQLQIQQHLGVGLDVALMHAGWEWKVETTLRRHGLVSWARPSRRSSAGYNAPVMAA